MEDELEGIIEDLINLVDGMKNIENDEYEDIMEKILNLKRTIVEAMDPKQDEEF